MSDARGGSPTATAPRAPTSKPSADLQPQALLDTAKQLFQNGNLSESEAHYKKALAFKETAADALYGLGVIYLRRQMLPAATISFQQSLERNPNNANAHYYLGEIWEKQGTADAALGFYKTALKLNGNHQAAKQKIAQYSNLSNQGTDSAPSDSGSFIAILKNDSSPIAREAVRAIEKISLNVTLRASSVAGLLFKRFIILFIYCMLLYFGIVKHIISGIHLNSAPTSIPSIVFNIVIPVGILLESFSWIIWQKTFRVIFEEGRVRLTFGIFSRRTETLELYSVEHVNLSQTFFQRLTGDGTITLYQGGRPTTLAGLAPIGKMRELFDDLRNVIQILRSGPWGKGVYSPR